MKKQSEVQEPAPASDTLSSDLLILLDRKRFLRLLDTASGQPRLSSLRKKTTAIKQIVSSETGGDKLFSDGTNTDAISLRRDVLTGELDQIIEAQTLERARYYLKRLAGGVKREKTSAVNDINLGRWKEYEEVLTDSLWLLPKRDTAGAHLGWYWGNFIPQIPRQLLLRYTKKNDWVLDTFLGSGTTLIECRRMGRNGVGIELNPKVARKARETINRESNPDNVRTEILKGDSKTIEINKALARLGVRQVQLLVMHPPYHDIITFSENKKDLSMAKSAEEFLNMFGEALDNVTPALERGRYFALVIGDKYEKGEWVPLGFECMNEVLKRDYTLKSIIVKNFEETRAKRDQKQLWRYRALVGGFYVFKHEYIFLFRKR
ncbi:MAG: DNA methyltransferase [Blastocatellia bacterium]